MARGGHGLHKVSGGPAIPYPSTPCKWATPETAQGWPARKASGLQPFSTPLVTPRRTHMELTLTRSKRRDFVIMQVSLAASLHFDVYKL
jgi:hypothetical protein